MESEVKCPDCGERGSIRRVVMYNRNNGKRLSFISEIALGVLAILPGVVILLVLIFALFFGKGTSNSGDDSGAITFIFFLAVFGVLPTAIGVCLIHRGVSMKRSPSSDIMRFYKLGCSICKKKWDQWQTQGWEDIQCIECESRNVTTWTSMVDPSGEPVTTDTLIRGLLGLLCSALLIVFGIWKGPDYLPGSGLTYPPFYCGLLGMMILSWSLLLLEKHARRKKQVTYVCFVCKHKWLREAQNPPEGK